MIFTGFRPRYVMWKQSSASGQGWFIYDTARDTVNVMTQNLYANASNAEETNTAVDMLSNGFKFRTGGAFANGSGATYIYMAFAETPFRYSLGR